MDKKSDVQIFQAGHYRFELTPVHAPRDCIDIVVRTSIAERYTPYHKIELPDCDPQLFVQTVLELEAAQAVVENNFLDLRKLFWNNDYHKEPLSPWGWIEDFPFDYDADSHHTIESYCAYHYDIEGIKTKIEVENALNLVIVELRQLYTKELQLLRSDQLNTHSKALGHYAAQCDAIIERVLLDMNTQSSSKDKSPLRRSFKV